jgi:hypothetical protein
MLILNRSERVHLSTLAECEVARQVSDFLSLLEVTAENGWSSQISSNKQRWYYQADEAYITREEHNCEALAIIYNSCSAVVKLNVGGETSAKSAWNTLPSLYSLRRFLYNGGSL